MRVFAVIWSDWSKGNTSTRRKKVRVFQGTREDEDPSPAFHAACGLGLYWKRTIFLSPATRPCCHWSACGGSEVPRRGSSCAPCFRKVLRWRQVRGEKPPRTGIPCPASMHVELFSRAFDSALAFPARAWAWAFREDDDDRFGRGGRLPW
jgi:hypothetical protein